MIQQTADLILSQWKKIQPGEYTASQFIANFTRLVESLEKSFQPEEIVRSLSPLREQLRYSPFLQRAQHWPRGYAGDYETIEYLIRGINGAPANHPAYSMEEFFLTSPICEQHRNKLIRQSDLIRSAINGNPNASILSIGCGTSEDMVMSMDAILGSDVSITLMDIDEAALNHSASRLTPIKQHLTLMRGNIYRSAARIPGKYDLVIIGGVFDYLDDRMISGILASLKSRIADQGVLFFTNIKSGNPYRACMEYMANWVLKERTEAQIRQLIQASGLNGMACLLETDATGLTILVTLYS